MTVTIAEALNDLADYTPLQIAEKLSAEGLLTCPNRATHCPIAQYLFQRTGYGVVVSHNDSFGFDDKRTMAVNPNPLSVRHFIDHFDKGLFKYLRNDRPVNK